MHPLGSRETADNIFYNRRDDRRNRIFQFTDHFRLTDERHLLYKQVDLDLTIDIRPEITIPYPFVDCLLYTSPSPRDISGSRMPSSA